MADSSQQARVFLWLWFFQGYIVQLFRELIDRQTWSDEGSVSQRMLRSYLLMFACVRGYQPCVDKAERLFQEWKESNGNLRSALSLVWDSHGC